MTPRFHPTAIVDPGADLADTVTIGPHAIVGAQVTVGPDTTIGAHAVLESGTRLGARCHVGYGAILGAPPQDRKYAGEPTHLEIGDGTVIREYATLHRATAASGLTRVGAGCLLMAYVHVAHDCRIGNHVTIANAVQLAGHVTIGAHVNIGGLTPIHQFVRIGDHAFVGGGSRVPQDIPPYTRAAGNPLRLVGINTVGLTRAGVGRETLDALQHAYRLLFNSRLRRAEAIERLRGEAARTPEVAHLLGFVGESERGVLAG
jgi:UDP-N-acetylglucosamine acyltransferase